MTSYDERKASSKGWSISIYHYYHLFTKLLTISRYVYSCCHCHYPPDLLLQVFYNHEMITLFWIEPFHFLGASVSYSIACWNWWNPLFMTSTIVCERRDFLLLHAIHRRWWNNLQMLVLRLRLVLAHEQLVWYPLNSWWSVECTCIIVILVVIVGVFVFLDSKMQCSLVFLLEVFTSSTSAPFNYFRSSSWELRLLVVIKIVCGFSRRILRMNQRVDGV